MVGALDDGVNEWELWTSADNGVNWTFRLDLGSGSIGQIPDFAQFGDTLYIVNGKMAPRKWNGTAVSATGRTQSPTPTAAASASAGTLLGTFKYKLVSIKSDGTRGAGSVSSAAVSVQDKQMSLSWTADTDVTVVGYEIYRTSGTGAVYYFTDYSDGRLVVAYTDNTSDADILENRVMEEHGDAPPTTYYCEPHKQRLWWGRTDTNPTRAYWSDPGLAEDVLSDNFLDFSDSETVGDILTGMIGNYEGKLVVFTEKAVWTVSGTGQVIGNIVDWSRIRTNAGTGSVSHRSVVRVPAGSKYSDQEGKIQITPVTTLAYLTVLGDIRLFDGDNDTIISHPVKTALSTFAYAHRAKIHALHDAVNRHIIWFYPDGTDTEPTKAVVWNYQWGVWYVWQTMPFAASVETDTSTAALVLLVGEADTAKGGYVYRLWSGNSFDGSNINSIWMTKTLYGVTEKGVPALPNQKRWRWADFLFEINQAVTLTVDVLNGVAADNASALFSTTLQPTSGAILTSDGGRLVSAGGDILRASNASAQVKTLLKTSAGDYLHDTGIRLRVGDNATVGSWSLEAFALAYQILPGLQRRSQ